MTATGPWAIYEEQVEPLLRQRWAVLYSSELKHCKDNDWRGPCPLHGGDGKTSFSVNPEALTWCCFSGCDAEPGQDHAGGGPVEYLMRRDHLTREQARDALAKLVGISLEAQQEAVDQPLDGEALARAWSAWCLGRKLDRRAIVDRWQCCLLAWMRRPAVSFPVPTGDRIRFLDSGANKTTWRTRGGKPCWYGLAEALGFADAATVYLVNGEPSVWAAQQAGVPAICTCAGEGIIPEPGLLAQLAEALVRRGAERIAVVYDLDAVGRAAAPRMVEALRKARIEAVALELPAELGAHGDVDDLHRRVGDAGLKAALEALPEVDTGQIVISNFLALEDGRFEVGQAEIVATVHQATRGWPRTFNGLLFAADPPPASTLPTAETIRYLDGAGAADKLTTWLRRFARVEWCGGDVRAADRPGKRAALTRSELHRALELESKFRYQAIELVPHQPLRPATYYACGELPSGNGHALADFLDMLNPDSELDSDLLCAALVTPGWGGEPGCRPGFVLTSEHGVGSGKTATAEALAAAWGGATSLQPDEDWQQTVQRLLSDDALARRCVLVDNIRGRLANGAIEAAITADAINGKRMYYGDFRRPNTMTWLLTVNVAELSRDLADRCVVIRIGPPQHGVDFRSRVAEFIQGRRFELLCDCLAFLREQPRCAIQPANRDRFQAWQDAVLARLPDGNELAAEIRERRPAVDADASEAQEVVDALAQLLKQRGHCPDHALVFLPFRDVQELLAVDLGTKSKQELGRRLRVLCQQGPLRRVLPNYRHAYHGRGLLWQPLVRSDDPIKRLNGERAEVFCPICSPAVCEGGAGWHN